MNPSWPELFNVLPTIRLMQAMHYHCRSPLFGQPHTHRNVFHISSIHSGRCRVFVDGQEYLAEPGTVFFLRPHQEHASQESRAQQWELTEIKFSVPDDHAAATIPPLPVVMKLPESSDIVPSLQKLVNAYQLELSNEPWLSRTRLIDVLMLLWMQATTQALPGKPPDENDRRVQQVVAHIAKHYASPLTLPELADLAGMSVSHFSAQFRRAMHLSPIQFLIDRRLTHARELLLNTALSVTEIARVCGICSVQQFCRLFRNRYHTSPGRFRTQSGHGG